MPAEAGRPLWTAPVQANSTCRSASAHHLIPRAATNTRADEMTEIDMAHPAMPFTETRRGERTEMPHPDGRRELRTLVEKCRETDPRLRRGGPLRNVNVTVPVESWPSKPSDPNHSRGSVIPARLATSTI